MSTIFKYVPKVGDRVKIITPISNSYNTPYAGKFGEVKAVNSCVEVAEVEVEIDPFNKKAIHAYYEELKLIQQPLMQVKTLENLVENQPSNTKEGTLEPVEVDHLCMPTAQTKNEPIGKGDVVDEIGKFVNYLKSNGWLLDSLNIELYNQNDEEDYVIVRL